MPHENKLLSSARTLCVHAARALNAPFSLRVWDGSIVLLGENLWDNCETAVRIVGSERYRLWLGCVSFPLGDGSACLFRMVATKHASKGHSGIPPTHRHLFESRRDRLRAA